MLWSKNLTTQAFDDFVTRRMHNAGDAPDVKFFDQSIDAKRNRSRLQLKKKDTPFLHSASARRDLKTVEAVEPSGDGLPPLPPGQRAYKYAKWPLEFRDGLLGTPRAIPGIISAEFDRRSALRSALRSRHGDDARWRGFRLNFGATGPRGERSASPEVTAFVLFFVAFAPVIGKDVGAAEERRRGAAGRWSRGRRTAAKAATLPPPGRGGGAWPTSTTTWRWRGRWPGPRSTSPSTRCAS